MMMMMMMQDFGPPLDTFSFLFRIRLRRRLINCAVLHHIISILVSVSFLASTSLPSQP